jgi:hypothetical protein
MGYHTGTEHPEAIGLVAGSYKVNVTDINGCTVFRPIEINEPDPLIIDYSVTLQPVPTRKTEGSTLRWKEDRTILFPLVDGMVSRQNECKAGFLYSYIY